MRQPAKSKTSRKNWHAAIAERSRQTYQNSSDLSEFSSFLPVIFHSPYIDTDYQIFEAAWANTLIGPAINTRVEYAIGNGMRPVFTLKDRKVKDDNKKKEILQQYDDIINELETMDNNRRIKTSLKAADTLRNTHVYGRGVLAFEPGGVGDKARLPIACKPINPRDLGRVFVHQLDWSVSSIYAFQKTDLIHAEEMIYLCQFPNSPVRRAMHYGYSSIQAVMGQARAIRAINEFDIPEIAHSIWAKYGLLTVDQENMTDEEREADLKTILKGLKPGSFNVINGKKDEINYFPLDTDPKVDALSEILDKLDRDIIGNWKVPGGLLGREADQTRATMLGKIRMFTSGPVQTDRAMVGECYGPDWYEHNIKLLGHEDILKIVNVEVAFEPVIIEDWTDNIAALQQLKNLIPSIPEEELLRMADLEDLIGKLPTKSVGPDGKPLTPNTKTGLDSDWLKEIADSTTDIDIKNKIMQKLENPMPA